MLHRCSILDTTTQNIVTVNAHYNNPCIDHRKGGTGRNNSNNNHISGEHDQSSSIETTNIDGDGKWALHFFRHIKNV